MPKISDREDFFSPRDFPFPGPGGCTRSERRQNTKSRRDMASGNNFRIGQLRAIGGTRRAVAAGAERRARGALFVGRRHVRAAGLCRRMNDSRQKSRMM
jgi:hypothetical protein